MLRPYDYGEAKNLKKYGLKQPPIYNLTNIQAPVILWYGRGDDLVNFEVTDGLKKYLLSCCKKWKLISLSKL